MKVSEASWGISLDFFLDFLLYALSYFMMG